jgi:dihydrolipoamide dehydrogenase
VTAKHKERQMPKIIIIGAGPGGYAAAFKAARAGAFVTLVDKSDMGGTCLNNGCIPTKTIKASADALKLARRLDQFGIVPAGFHPFDAGTAFFNVDMPSVQVRKENVRKTLCAGLEKTCVALKVRLVRGQAELQAGGSVLVHTASGIEIIHGDAIILANGSKTLDLPSLPVDHTWIFNSDDALDLHTIPRRMLIVGGGVIGCEFAFIYRAFGSDVTIVEGLDRLLPLPSVDVEISRLLQREAKKCGLHVALAQTVKSVTVSRRGVTCELGTSPFMKGITGPDISIEVDAVLVAVGRAPNCQGLNLSEAGVATDATGWIVVDDRMRTSVDGIYAIGDTLGPSRIMLAHSATAEGLCAVDNCLGNKIHMDYSVIPSAIFTSPEIGIVGLSEAQAKEQGRDVRSCLVQFREMGKAHAMGELPGFFKLVCEKGSGRILGVHIAGAHSTDIIAEAALAIKNSLTVEDVANTIHAHPTLAEGMCEAAQAWLRV